jgi:hypothetical protein
MPSPVGHPSSFLHALTGSATALRPPAAHASILHASGALRYLPTANLLQQRLTDTKQKSDIIGSTVAVAATSPHQHHAPQGGGMPCCKKNARWDTRLYAHRLQDPLPSFAGSVTAIQRQRRSAFAVTPTHMVHQGAMHMCLLARETSYSRQPLLHDWLVTLRAVCTIVPTPTAPADAHLSHTQCRPSTASSPVQHIQSHMYV